MLSGMVCVLFDRAVFPYCGLKGTRHCPAFVTVITAVLCVLAVQQVYYTRRLPVIHK